MKEVDARGLSCPEPLMLTEEALKGATEAVKVLVIEPHQRKNVEKYAQAHGKKAVATEKEDYFEIVIEWDAASCSIPFCNRCKCYSCI